MMSHRIVQQGVWFLRHIRPDLSDSRHNTFSIMQVKPVAGNRGFNCWISMVGLYVYINKEVWLQTELHCYPGRVLDGVFKTATGGQCATTTAFQPRVQAGRTLRIYCCWQPAGKQLYGSKQERAVLCVCVCRLLVSALTLCCVLTWTVSRGHLLLENMIVSWHRTHAVMTSAVLLKCWRFIHSFCQ